MKIKKRRTAGKTAKRIRRLKSLLRLYKRRSGLLKGIWKAAAARLNL